MNNDKCNQIQATVDSGQFDMFFKWKEDIYGAPENSRVIFANMIQPDKDMIDFGKFFATNLSAGMYGQPYQRIFYKGNIPDIQIITKEDALRELK